MTPIEIILLLAVVFLAAQLLLLQRHYNDKFSAQAMVLSLLVDVVLEKTADTRQIDRIKDKIFDSSL